MTVRHILVPSFWSYMASIAIAVSNAELNSPLAMALATGVVFPDDPLCPRASAVGFLMDGRDRVPLRVM